MSDPERRARRDDPGPQIESESEPHPAEMLVRLMNAESGGGRRAAQSSQPVSSGPTTLSPAAFEPSEPHEEVSPAARGLAAMPANSTPDDPSAAQRAMQGLRSAMPVVQKLLPLLDGNILAALANVLAPHPHAQQKPPDLSPLQSALTDLKAQQRDLRAQVVEQNSSLRRIVTQIENIREATDRNTLEQQELIDELKAAGKRMNIVALVAFALLAISVALNVFLYFQIQRLLP
jgi:hypothetical protein